MIEGKRVIVVENRSERRSLFNDVLSGMGCDVVKCSEAAPDVSTLRELDPHVAVVHCWMDQIRLLRVVEEMSNGFAGVAIVVVTNFQEQEFRLKAMSAGATTVVAGDRLSVEFRPAIENAYIESLKKRRGKVSDRTAFVAMPFSSTFRKRYDRAIKPATESVGLRCVRLDDEIFTGALLEKMYREVQLSTLVIADVTRGNANVMYEVGYAHAFGKVVVFIAEEARHVPFDVRGQRQIIYGRGTQKLASELENMLRLMR